MEAPRRSREAGATCEPGGSLRVAAVQAHAHTGSREYRNVARAVEYAEEAAAAGARLISFPEAYPGPATGPLDWGRKLDCPPEEQLAAVAKRLGVYITAGGLEECEHVAGAHHVTQKLYGPDGTILCNYRRVQPDNPDMNAFFYAGRRHIVPGNEIPVIRTRVGRIGLQICGELFVPEISRVQMLRGADLLVAPVNGSATRTRMRGMALTWQHIARARAAENLVYVIVPQKFLIDGPGGGIAIIAGPEEIVARSTRPGLLVADLDLDRLHWQRSRLVDSELLQPPSDSEGAPSSAARCGQHADRRPDLYGPLVEPQPEAYDFEYFRRETSRENEATERIPSASQIGDRTILERRDS